MRTKVPDPQFLLDESGEKAFVVLNIKDYEELLEDLHDLKILHERRNEPATSIEVFEAELKADGLL